MESDILVRPFRKCRASAFIPGSKSITNRAMMLAALAGGRTLLKDALFSRDTIIMADCLKKLGYMVELDRNENSITIESAYGSIPNSEAEIFVGNAGTAARFVTSLVALRKNGKFKLTADEAMFARPIKGLIDALKSQGATFDFLGEPDHLPFVIHTSGLNGGDISIDAGESSQMLSGLLMASVAATSPMTVNLSGGTVSKPFVKMTVDMMRQFGFSCECNGTQYNVALKPTTRSDSPRIYNIEPDATAASYFIALPIVVGGVCEIQNFGSCKLQGDAAFVDLIESIGLIKTKKQGNNLLVFASENTVFPELVELDFNDISDTFLTLAAISMHLPFKLRITGIAHTRQQETDRIAAVARELRKFCASVEETDDSIFITPYPREELVKRLPQTTIVNTYDDHRLAMSFAIAACADIRGDGSAWIEIENPTCVSKTWENFFEVLFTSREDSRQFRVVAVDGGAAVGKSSVSRECSGVLDYMHVDTGAHYRTISYGLLAAGAESTDKSAIVTALSNIELGTVLEGNSAKMTINGNLIADSEIRNERINQKVAEFAAIKEVREFLKNYQRSMSDFAVENGFDGMIMEGRDIGSVIFPDADVRIFLDADEETRAARRAKEGISDSIKKRDELDKNRKTAPLKQPEGAELIDTSHLTKEEVVDKTLLLIIES